ncbi:MAG: hypothetical protein F4213_06455 [Boseongicola sp. SB0677_bin_26]|nr:hypothetical protein [Boseongicola sp. SB0665_bin_10]MYG25651.1 hypothetical protein [Boseongicola sp. SB0677_bin_26]
MIHQGEPGLHVMLQVAGAALSAVLTGPLGNIDIPDASIDAVAAQHPFEAVEVLQETEAGKRRLGWISSDTVGRLNLPDHFIDALIATEDIRLGLHPGVDPVALVSAAWDTAMGRTRGGSGVAQQLVKNAITGPALTLERKVIEAILALRLTAAAPAEAILESYLTHAWFGRGVRGASMAAPAWFGKPWHEIMPHESAFLAGLLKSPAAHDPDGHPDRAKHRRDLVLRRMHQAGAISGTDLAAGLVQPVGTIPYRPLPPPRWIASALARMPPKGDDDQIRVTIRPAWQAIASEALRDHLNSLGNPEPAGSVAVALRADPDGSLGLLRPAAARHLGLSPGTGRMIVTSIEGELIRGLLDRGSGSMIHTESAWTDAPLAVGDVLVAVDGGEVRGVPGMQGAVLIMAHDGKILAYVGGSEPDLLPLDRARAKRSPGSALKPFLWAAAMRDGLLPNDLVPNVVTAYRLADGSVWRPENFDLSETAPVPAWQALEISSNLAAARIAHATGIDSLKEVTESLGIYQDIPLHPATSLGTHETDLLRLTAGYAALANGGYRVRPSVIDEEKQDTPVPVLDPWIARELGAMLHGVTRRGTAARAFADFEVAVAGKTGTSGDHRDAWFVGYVPGVVIGVWIGRDDAKPLPGGMTGGRVAAPLARRILQEALARDLFKAVPGIVPPLHPM